MNNLERLLAPPHGKGVVLKAAFVIAMIGLPSAATASCLPKTSPIAGELRLVETRHPNGSPLKAYVLFSGSGQCVTVIDDDDKPQNISLRDIHIVLADTEKKNLKRLLGATVTVQGGIEAPMTAYHLGSLIMFDAKVIKVEDTPG